MTVTARKPFPVLLILSLSPCPCPLALLHVMVPAHFCAPEVPEWTGGGPWTPQSPHVGRQVSCEVARQRTLPSGGQLLVGRPMHLVLFGNWSEGFGEEANADCVRETSPLQTQPPDPRPSSPSLQQPWAVLLHPPG